MTSCRAFSTHTLVALVVLALGASGCHHGGPPPEHPEGCGCHEGRGGEGGHGQGPHGGCACHGEGGGCACRGGQGGCACHGGQGPGQGPRAGSMCPMEVPGVAVSAADVDGGGALVFTAPADQVPFLQVRVRALAQRFNLMQAGPPPGAQAGGPGHGCSCGGGGGGGGCRHGGQPPAAGPEGGQPGPAGPPAPPPPSFATAEDTPDGARLVVLAAGADWVEPVRQHLRQRAQRMSEGPAPAQQPQPAPQPAPQQ